MSSSHWILLILSIYVTQAEYDVSKDNVLVEIKNLIFKPKSVENVTFAGDAVMVVCVGDYVDSASLDHNDCRYFNSYKPFNLSSAVTGVFRGVTTLPKKAVQINLNFKVHVNLPDGKDDWKKYTYTTSSPLELGNRFPLAETAPKFQLEGEMFVDCIEQNLRPFCIPLGGESSETATGKGKRHIDSRTDDASTFPSPLVNYTLTGFLIVLILVLVFVKVIYPKCIRKSPENSAAARQIL